MVDRPRGESERGLGEADRRPRNMGERRLGEIDRRPRDLVGEPRSEGERGFR